MLVAIGEVLFDEFVDHRRLGGAPFNVACHLRRFGLPVALVSRVGQDDDGRQIRSRLAEIGLDPRTLQQDPDRPTGRVKVILDAEGQPDFDIVSNVAYDHIRLDGAVKDLMDAGPGLIYFGTLAQRTPDGHRRLKMILDRRPADARCLYDMNLRPGHFSTAVVEASLRRCDILKLSVDELASAQDMFHLSGDVAEQCDRLMDRFGLMAVALTCGARGAALYADGRCHWAAAKIQGRLRDTVGAGDAFSAVLAAGLLAGWPPSQILSRAVTFAGRICTVSGAIPPDLVHYREIIHAIGKEAP